MMFHWPRRKLPKELDAARQHASVGNAVEEFVTNICRFGDAAVDGEDAFLFRGRYFISEVLDQPSPALTSGVEIAGLVT